MLDKKQRIEVLTSFRFIAAILIVYYHSYEYFDLPRIGDLLSISQGVSFFFVLSGFVLAYSYASNSGKSWREFYVSRIARIWPAHIAAMALWLVLSGQSIESMINAPQGWSIWLANLFLLQSWLPCQSVFFSFNAVAWSLSTELTFYAVFPAIIVAWRRSRMTLPWGSVAAGALLVVVYVWLTTHLGLRLGAGPADPSILGFLVNPLTRIFEFCLGVLVYGLHEKFKQHAAQMTRPLHWTLLEALALVASLVSMWVSIDGHVVHFSSDAIRYYVFWAGSAPVFAAMILVFSFARGWFSEKLSGRAYVLLGEVSFSLYLVHYPVLLWFERYPRVFQGSGPSFCVYLIACLMLAWLMYSLVESYFRKLILGWGFMNEKLAVDRRQAWRAATLLLLVALFAASPLWMVGPGHAAPRMEVNRFLDDGDRIAIDGKFGSVMKLVTAKVLDASGDVTVEMLWQALETIPVGYRMTVYLLDANRKIIAQRDDRFMRGVGLEKGQFWISRAVFEKKPAVLREGGEIGVVVYQHVTREREQVAAASTDWNQSRLLLRQGARLANTEGK